MISSPNYNFFPNFANSKAWRVYQPEGFTNPKGSKPWWAGLLAGSLGVLVRDPLGVKNWDNPRGPSYSWDDPSKWKKKNAIPVYHVYSDVGPTPLTSWAKQIWQTEVLRDDQKEKLLGQSSQVTGHFPWDESWKTLTIIWRFPSMGVHPVW